MKHFLMIMLSAMLATSAFSQQIQSTTLDLRKKNKEFSFEAAELTTPTFRAYIRENGSSYTSVSNIGGVFFFASNDTATVGMAVTNTSSGLDYLEWTLTTSQTVEPGTYFAQIIITNNAGSLQEWVRGEFEILDSPGTTAVNFWQWNCTNGFATTAWVEEQIAAIEGVTTNGLTGLDRHVADTNTVASDAKAYTDAQSTNNTYLNADGSVPITGLSQKYSGNLVVSGNTSDGSDNLALTLAGGGGAYEARGAYVIISGNEDDAGSWGNVKIFAGARSDNTDVGYISFLTGNAGGWGSERMRIRNSGLIDYFGNTNYNLRLLSAYLEGMTGTAITNGAMAGAIALTNSVPWSSYTLPILLDRGNSVTNKHLLIGDGYLPSYADAFWGSYPPVFGASATQKNSTAISGIVSNEGAAAIYAHAHCQGTGNDPLAAIIATSQGCPTRPALFAFGHNGTGAVVTTYGEYDLNGGKITDVGAPTLPTDAATKGYVDTVLSAETLSTVATRGNSWTGSLSIASLMATYVYGSNSSLRLSPYAAWWPTPLPTITLHRDNGGTLDGVYGPIFQWNSNGTHNAEFYTNVSFSLNRLINVGDPATPTDGATKGYVDEHSGITNIVSTSGGTSLVYGVAGSVATNKGLISGSGISISDNGANLTIAATGSSSSTNTAIGFRAYRSCNQTNATALSVYISKFDGIVDNYNDMFSTNTYKGTIPYAGSWTLSYRDVVQNLDATYNAYTYMYKVSGVTTTLIARIPVRSYAADARLAFPTIVTRVTLAAGDIVFAGTMDDNNVRDVYWLGGNYFAEDFGGIVNEFSANFNGLTP